MENLDLNQNGTNSAGFGSGEQNAQNQGAQNSQNAQGFQNQNDTQNSEQVQENASLKLSDYLENQKRENNEIKSYTDEQGRTIFVPKNEQRKEKQLDALVNCIDDCCEKTNELISLEFIDTREVKTMKNLFRDSPRKDYKGIEKWDTSKVTCFEGMFAGTDFNEDISGWDVSNARTFEAMFAYTSEFNQPIGAHWDTQNVTNMIRMFCFAKKFNNGGQPFGEKWKMDKVEWTWEMFWGAENFNAGGLYGVESPNGGGLNEWNMSKVTKCYTMFNGAKAFNQPLDKWDLSNAVNLGSMFNKAESFNQDLSAWGERLGKAQNMYRMFADTKALTIDFLSAWKIPSGCNYDNIKKGSALETSGAKTAIKGKKSQLFDFVVSELVGGEKEFTKFGRATKFLGTWMPKNIQDKFGVYLAKYTDDDDENELETADENSWEVAFCELFNHNFLIEKVGENKKEFDKKWGKKEREFNIYQARKSKDFEDFNESKAEPPFGNDELTIYLAPQNIWIINTSPFDSSERILNIVNAFVLLKAYKTKMRELDTMAKNCKDTKKNAKELQNAHKELCEFDLHAYQSTPIVQTALDDTFLIKVWRKMSELYMVETIHDELKETIFQISQLVSNQNQNKLSRRMLWVALVSALAAVPVIQDFLLWVANLFGF